MAKKKIVEVEQPENVEQAKNVKDESIKENFNVKDCFTKEEIADEINKSRLDDKVEIENEAETVVVRFYLDKRIFLNKDIISDVSENFISLDLTLPSECFNMVVVSAPECDAIERQLIDTISQQYWLESNGLLDSSFNDGIEE